MQNDDVVVMTMTNGRPKSRGGVSPKLNGIAEAEKETGVRVAAPSSSISALVASRNGGSRPETTSDDTNGGGPGMRSGAHVGAGAGQI